MPLSFTPAQFDRAFDKVVLGGRFFEADAYYPTYRRRYRRTLEYITGRLGLPDDFSMIEIGGGQMLLLAHELFGTPGKVVDVNDAYAQPIREVGIDHAVCDLLREDLPDRDAYDAAVLCEVIEHMPVPPYLVLERIARWIKPGGFIFLTTPNLHRLRNIIHLAMGRPTFCPLFFPDPGHGIGHPVEQSAENLRFHLERAGLEAVHVEITTLVNRSMNPLVNAARLALSPLHAVRPILQENLVAWGRKPQAGLPVNWSNDEAQRLAREWIEQNELTRPRADSRPSRS